MDKLRSKQTREISKNPNTNLASEKGSTKILIKANSGTVVARNSKLPLNILWLLVIS
jgi:hypothetical protein